MKKGGGGGGENGNEKPSVAGAGGKPVFARGTFAVGTNYLTTAKGKGAGRGHISAKRIQRSESQSPLLRAQIEFRPPEETEQEET